MKHAQVLPILLAFACLSSWAQWYDPKTGAPVPDTEWRKQTGDMGAMLAVTSQIEPFLKEWYETKEAHIPNLKTTDKAKRGDVIGALLFFSGCGEEGGTCGATVDFKVLSPDGSVYGEHNDNKIWPGPAAKKKVVLLSQAHLQIRIEPKDPFGKYVVVAELKNASSKSLMRLSQKFEVVQ